MESRRGNLRWNSKEELLEKSPERTPDGFLCLFYASEHKQDKQMHRCSLFLFHAIQSHYHHFHLVNPQYGKKVAGWHIQYAFNRTVNQFIVQINKALLPYNSLKPLCFSGATVTTVEYAGPTYSSKQHTESTSSMFASVPWVDRTSEMRRSNRTKWPALYHPSLHLSYILLSPALPCEDSTQGFLDVLTCTSSEHI